MKTILVIDGTQELLSDLLTILRFEGYEAIAAHNGREGVLAAQRRRELGIDFPEIVDLLKAHGATE